MSLSSSSLSFSSHRQHNEQSPITSSSYPNFKMGSHAYTYHAAGPFGNDFDSQHSTGANLLQVRRNRVADTFQVLYSGSDIPRYPGDAIAQSAETAPTATVARPQPDPVKKAALSRHLEEVFGLDLTESAEPHFQQESVEAGALSGSSNSRSQKRKTGTKKRASLCRKLKFLARSLFPESHPFLV